MRKKENNYPGLNEIVFEKRNQSYGSFYLRGKYGRYLFLSLILGIFIFTVAILVPFLVYYFEPYDLYGEMPDMIEYYSLEPPSQEDLAEIARLMAKPPPEAPPVPVVVDSVKEKEEQKPEEQKPEDQQNQEQTSDTASGKETGNAKEGKGAGDDTGLYTTIDVYPQFPGGDKARLFFIRNNIHYPETALKSGIQGVVIVLFVIETDGSVSNVQVTKNIGGGCDEEAIRVTKSMPLWSPGKRNGRPVRVLVKMPIVFRIPGNPIQ
jgi:protein TonB